MLTLWPAIMRHMRHAFKPKLRRILFVCIAAGLSGPFLPDLQAIFHNR